MKSRIWETKEGKYAKALAKIQVTAIFLKRDMWRNCFTLNKLTSVFYASVLLLIMSFELK